MLLGYLHRSASVEIDAAGYSSEEPFAILASKPINYENGRAAFEAAPKITLLVSR